MGKGEKKRCQKVKEEGESSATNDKGRHRAPSEHLRRLTRWSTRQLAMGDQSSIKEIKSPTTEEFSPTEKVTQEPSTLLACTRQKSIRALVSIDSPKMAKRGRFVEENNTNEKEISGKKIQPCQSQTSQAKVSAQVTVACPLSLKAEISVIALTEIVNLEGKDSLEDSDDEINSSTHHTLYYGVKDEYTPLIASIFENYGDIAKNHTLKSSLACSLFLEMVCVIIQKLKKLTYKNITIEDLNSMLRALDDVESNGIQVDWLRKRIKEIEEVKKEAKTIMSNSKSIKEERDRINTEIEEVEMGMQMDEIMLRAKQNLVQEYEEKIKGSQRNLEKAKEEMETIRERKYLLVRKLDELKSNYDEIHTQALHIRNKVHSLYLLALVEGLL